MRWPFTTFATGTLLVCCLPLVLASLALGQLAPGAWWLAPLPLLAFFLNFFRDPERTASGDDHDLVSPADGLVADIVSVDDPDLGVPCRRIGVFLSVFDVHVNSSPTRGKVVGMSTRDGGFFDARDPRAIDENRACTLVLERPDGRRLGVRQITGLIARRIVTPVVVGDSFERGERYGMIRFGSRTELIIPETELADVKVSVGMRVKRGETLLARMTEAAAARAATTPDEPSAVPVGGPAA